MLDSAPDNDLRFTVYDERIMPNPKRRHSKSRTRQRRAHDALKTPQFYLDKDSGEPKVPHRIDEKGTYKGRQIIDVKENE